MAPANTDVEVPAIFDIGIPAKTSVPYAIYTGSATYRFQKPRKWIQAAVGFEDPCSDHVRFFYPQGVFSSETYTCYIAGEIEKGSVEQRDIFLQEVPTSDV